MIEVVVTEADISDRLGAVVVLKKEKDKLSVATPEHLDPEAK